MRRARLPILAGAALAAAALAAPAEACTVSANGVAFGNYSFSNPAPTDGVGTISLNCHRNTTSPVVAIDAGNSGSFSPRRMRNGTRTLNYNLFTSASHSVVWGNGSSGTATVSPSGTVSGNSRLFSVPVYGRIPAGQNAAAGSYSDTLMVTVTF
jgi:spore coat protein U-like protein